MLLVDTREKPDAIENILKYFDANGIEYERTKLFFGDFRIYERPQLVIDRKKNMNELAANVTYQIDRFERELQKATDTGSKLIILVEQNSYNVETVNGTKRIELKTLDDLYLWKHSKAEIYGDHVLRILHSLTKRYPVEVEFCNAKETGKRIVEILNEGNEEEKFHSI